MNLRMTLLIGFVILSLVALSVGAYIVFKFFTYRKDVILVEGFEITTQWQEIDVESVVPPVSEEMSSVQIAVPISYQAFDFKKGIVAPDGTVIDPVVEAVDASGKTYPYLRTGARRTHAYELASYTPVNPIGKGVKIVKVRLKSNHELRAQVILWSSFDPKNLP